MMAVFQRAIVSAAMLVVLGATQTICQAGNGGVISLGLGSQLFIDDYLIESQSGLTRRINSPSKFSSPLVGGTNDNNVTPYASVIRDADTGRFRMWYNSYSSDSVVNHLSSLESTDGFSWFRPHQVLDDPAPIQFGASVTDGGPTDSAPYKFAWWYGGGMNVATSYDGIDFTPIASGPVLSSNHDIVSLSYDPIRERYIGLTSYYGTGPWQGERRIPMQSVSTDLINWSAPQTAVTPMSTEDGHTEFYGMSGVIARGDLLIAMVKVLRDDLIAPGAPAGAQGIGYTVLAWSRDGEHWERDTEAFIDRNPVIGSWDHAMAWGDSQLVVSDQTYIYYGGYKWGHKYDRYTDRQIGLATMPVDRYVSRDADGDGGTLWTPLFTSEAESLTINASVQGELKIRVLDETGQPLSGFGWSDFSTIHGSSVGHLADWVGDFSLLRGTAIQLEFSLYSSQLYGFKKCMKTSHPSD